MSFDVEFHLYVIDLKMEIQIAYKFACNLLRLIEFQFSSNDEYICKTQFNMYGIILYLRHDFSWPSVNLFLLFIIFFIEVYVINEEIIFLLSVSHKMW